MFELCFGGVFFKKRRDYYPVAMLSFQLNSGLVWSEAQEQACGKMRCGSYFRCLKWHSKSTRFVP